GPEVAVFDGAGGQVVTTFFAFDPSFAGGVTVAVGDTNTDGVPDILTGAGPGGGPAVRVLSGAGLVAVGGPTLIDLGDYFAGSPQDRSGVRVATADLGGDRQGDPVTRRGSRGGANALAPGPVTP